MRKFIILFIGILPFNLFRIFCYNLFLGYKIDYKSQIGWLNYIDCEECILVNSKIGFLNRIKVRKLIMHADSLIFYANNLQYLNFLEMHRNSIINTSNAILGCYKSSNPYKEFSLFEIGENSLVTSHHYIDAVDTIKIGDNVVLAGTNSRILTHGFDISRVLIQAPVTISDNVYIGANSSILQGVKIASETIVGASTVVSKSIDTRGFYVSNELIRKADCQLYGNKEGVIKIGKYFYYRKVN